MRRLGLPLLPSTLRWALVGVIALVILFNSTVLSPPAPPGAGPDSFWDKKLHFAAYATFSASLAYATAQASSGPSRRVLLVSLAAISYGVGIELLQAPLPDRYFSYIDMLANTLGALLGLTYLAIERRVPYVPILDRF